MLYYQATFSLWGVFVGGGLRKIENLDIKEKNRTKKRKKKKKTKTRVIIKR